MDFQNTLEVELENNAFGSDSKNMLDILAFFDKVFGFDIARIGGGKVHKL